LAKEVPLNFGNHPDGTVELRPPHLDSEGFGPFLPWPKSSLPECSRLKTLLTYLIKTNSGSLTGRVDTCSKSKTCYCYFHCSQCSNVL